MKQTTKYTNQPIGTFGGFRHYVNTATGQYIVAGKGGANKKQLKSNPKLIRSLENSDEWKIVGKWSHQIRMSMSDIIHLAFGDYTAGLNQFAKNLQKMDVESLKGYRLIETSKFKPLLTSINFNIRHPFNKVLVRIPDVITDSQRKTITLNIPGFRACNEIIWPKPYHYFRFSLQIGQISDYIWNESERTYDQQYPDIEHHRVVVRSEWIDRLAGIFDLSLTASFPDEYLPVENATVVVALGIEIGTNETPGTISFKKGDGTMALVACL
ncbi:MAG: hypothetical protein HXX14_17540 [Bacteroidetes bacterium]|nr:hypothetical protein [Bacteroidota bacterium]